MSSRREQKEALKRERLERERQAKEADRRKRLVGYGVGGALAAAAVIAVVAALALGGGGGDGSGGEANANILPSGGSVPKQKTSNLKDAAKAAECKLQSYVVNVGATTEERHTSDIHAHIKYQSNPPAGGKHYQVPAQDGAYTTAPPDITVVHSEEHGRVVIWFKPGLPERTRADLKALFDEEQGYQMLLVPRKNMPYAVAATAWGRDPDPRGTGYTLGCTSARAPMYDALRAFIDEHRGRGPEVVP